MSMNTLATFVLAQTLIASVAIAHSVIVNCSRVFTVSAWIKVAALLLTALFVL